MIIRLREADFSRKNIGKLELTKELSAEVTNILENYTRNLTETQKFALDDFITGLKNNNIWDKINVMYMPVLSNNLTEAFINIKTLTTTTTPSSSKYSVANGWLKSTINFGDAQNTSTDTAQIMLNGSMMNLHFSLYMNGTSIRDTSTLIDTRATETESDILRMDMSNTSNSLIVLGTNSRFTTTPITGKGLVGFSSRTDGFTVIQQNSVSDTPEGKVAADTTITNKIAYVNRRISGWASTVVDWALMSTGNSLTLIEAQKYKELVDNFVLKLL